MRRKKELSPKAQGALEAARQILRRTPPHEAPEMLRRAAFAMGRVLPSDPGQHMEVRETLVMLSGLHHLDAYGIVLDGMMNGWLAKGVDDKVEGKAGGGAGE
jgi:hypothetical protein